MTMSYDDYFINLARAVAARSKDPTQVGAVVVGPNKEVRSTGYNGFPRKVYEIQPRITRPEKYLWVVHAETNCICQAARMGVSLAGCTLYLSTNPVPCAVCSGAIIQAGITEVVGPDTPFSGKGGHWEESMRVSKLMLAEAGVVCRAVPIQQMPRI